MDNTQQVGARLNMDSLRPEKPKEYLPNINDLPATKYVSPITPLKDEGGVVISAGEYNPIYGQKMIDFYADAPMKRTIIETMTWKNGEMREIEKEVACPPPMIGEFARSIGVRVSKLKMWAKKHVEFAEAVDECNEIVKEFIIINGLSGQYPSQFAIFVGKNLTDMKDKSTVETVHVDINKFLDQLEKNNTNQIADGI